MVLIFINNVNWRLLFGFVRICSIYYGLFDCVFQCSVLVVQHQKDVTDSLNDAKQSFSPVHSSPLRISALSRAVF